MEDQHEIEGPHDLGYSTGHQRLSLHPLGMRSHVKGLDEAERQAFRKLPLRRA
jgi:hypothetical protein